MEDLISGSLEDAMEALAKLAADLRTRPATYAEKQAAGMSDVLSSIGGHLQSNPAAGGALLGGGLGAGVGALSTAFGNRGKEDYERKSMLGGALGGGLAGAGLGAGAGLAYSGMKSMGQNQGVGHGDATPQGRFLDPTSGKQMQIDPKVLKSNPELAAKIRELSAKSTAGEQTAQGIGAGMAYLGGKALPYGNQILNATGLRNPEKPNWMERNIPTSTDWLPKIMGADALLHAKGLNMGERIGLGRIRPEFSNDMTHLQAGIGHDNVGAHPSIQDAIRKNVKNENGVMPKGQMGPSLPPGTHVPGTSAKQTGKGVTELLAGRDPGSQDGSFMKQMGRRLFGDRMGGTDPVLQTTHTPEIKETRTTGDGTPGNPKVTTEDVHKGTPKTESLTRSQRQTAAREGYKAIHGGKEAPPGLFRVGGRQVQMPGWKAGLGGRAALYGAVPFLEYGARGLMQEQDHEAQLKALMAQHAKEVPGK